MEYTKDIVFPMTRNNCEQEQDWKIGGKVQNKGINFKKVFSYIVIITAVLIAIDSFLMFQFVNLLQWL